MAPTENPNLDSVLGRCLCGAVEFRITFPTKWCAHCHCSMCRRAHGSAFVTWVGVPESQLELLSRDTLVVYRSSAAARRSFCSTCGSTLFFEGDRWPGEVHVVLANIDGEIDREPVAHVYFDVRVDWVTLHDDLAKLGGASGSQPLK